MAYRRWERPPGELPYNCTKRKCDDCGKEWVVGVQTARRKAYICPDCGRKSGKRTRSA